MLRNARGSFSPSFPSSFWGLSERSPGAHPCRRLCGSGVLCAWLHGIGGCPISAPSAPCGAACGRTAVRALADSEASAWLSPGLSPGRARRVFPCGAGWAHAAWPAAPAGKAAARGRGRRVPWPGGRRRPRPGTAPGAVPSGQRWRCGSPSRTRWMCACACAWVRAAWRTSVCPSVRAPGVGSDTGHGGKEARRCGVRALV